MDYLKRFQTIHEMDQMREGVLPQNSFRPPNVFLETASAYCYNANLGTLPLFFFQKVQVQICTLKGAHKFHIFS